MTQWHLHQYYQTFNHGTDEEILETRRTVNAGDRALPQQAGRAYSELVQTYLQLGRYHSVQIDEMDPAASILALEKIRRDMRAQKPRVQKVGKSANKGSHRVQALMNPDIDMRQLVKVMIMLAQYQVKQKKQGSEKPIDPQPPTGLDERDSN